MGAHGLNITKHGSPRQGQVQRLRRHYEYPVTNAVVVPEATRTDMDPA